MLLGFGDKYVFHYMSVVVFNMQIIIISCFSHKNNNRGTNLPQVTKYASPSYYGHTHHDDDEKPKDQ